MGNIFVMVSLPTKITNILSHRNYLLYTVFSSCAFTTLLGFCVSYIFDECVEMYKALYSVRYEIHDRDVINADCKNFYVFNFMPMHSTM